MVGIQSGSRNFEPQVPRFLKMFQEFQKAININKKVWDPLIVTDESLVAGKYSFGLLKGKMHHTNDKC